MGELAYHATKRGARPRSPPPHLVPSCPWPPSNHAARPPGGSQLLLPLLPPLLLLLPQRPPPPPVAVWPLAQTRERTRECSRAAATHMHFPRSRLHMLIDACAMSHYLRVRLLRGRTARRRARCKPAQHAHAIDGASRLRYLVELFCPFVGNEILRIVALLPLQLPRETAGYSNECRSASSQRVCDILFAIRL